MNLKKEIQRTFEKPRGFRDFLFLAVRLVDEEYNAEETADYSIRKGYASRLGFLAETALEAATNLGITERQEQIRELIKKLSHHRNQGYEFLFPYKNGEADRKMKEWVSNYKGLLNDKWHIYCRMSHSDIEEYLQLYLIDLRK